MADTKMDFASATGFLRASKESSRILESMHKFEEGEEDDAGEGAHRPSPLQ